MDVHPTKNGIFIGIDPYPFVSINMDRTFIGAPGIRGHAAHGHMQHTEPGRLPGILEEL